MTGIEASPEPGGTDAATRVEPHPDEKSTAGPWGLSTTRAIMVPLPAVAARPSKGNIKPKKKGQVKYVRENGDGPWGECDWTPPVGRGQAYF